MEDIHMSNKEGDEGNKKLLPCEMNMVEFYNFLQHSGDCALILDTSSYSDTLPRLVYPVSYETDENGHLSASLSTKAIVRLKTSHITHIFLLTNSTTPRNHILAAQDLIYSKSHSNQQYYRISWSITKLYPLNDFPLVNLIESSGGYIFLGNNLHANDSNVIRTLSIECIVNCASSMQEKPFQDIVYYDLNVSKENPEEGTFKSFDEAVDFMLESFQNHKRILVHSTYGRSRCCTLVVYFLMKAESISLRDAYHRVLRNRPQMMPKDAILDILLQKEKLLYGTSCFHDTDQGILKTKLKELTRGDMLSTQERERHHAALASIHSSDIKFLSSKNKEKPIEQLMIDTTTTRKRIVLESTVTCRWLFNRLQSGTGMLLIDARSRTDFEEDSIPSAISVPIQTTQSTLADVQNSLMSEQAHLFTSKKRKLREVVIYGDAIRQIFLQDTLIKNKPWMFRLGKMLVDEGLVTSVRYLEDGFTTFQFRYPFYTSLFLFDSQNDDDDSGNFLARTQSGTHSVNYPNEILDGFLYLGNMWHAQSSNVIRNLGITHIVNASLDTDNVFDEAGVVYHEVKIKDHVNADISAHFESTYRFIEGAKQLQHSRVLIHCTQGISRSCTLAIYYVMCTQRWSLVTAVNYCISNRGVCFPNQGFLQALMVEERKLYLANSLSTHELDLLVGNTLPDRPVPKPAPLESYQQKAENCQCCEKLFSFFDWRHRCGLCKGIICGKCSTCRLILNENLAEKGEVGRVCDHCVVHLYTIHLPLPFRLAFNILLDKYGMRTRRNLYVKSPSLKDQILKITYIPGTEASILLNVLRKRFQVREYELIDVTGDDIGLDFSWNLQSCHYLDIPDNVVLFASIGQSGTIPVSRRISSFCGNGRQRVLNPEHSYTTRSLPSNTDQTKRRTRSFSEGRALALQETLREREKIRKKNDLIHFNIKNELNFSPTSLSKMDDIRYNELWKSAFPSCSIIPKHILMTLSNEILMELMLGVAYLTSKTDNSNLNSMDEKERTILLTTLCKTIQVSSSTRQLLMQYIQLTPLNPI